MVTSTSESSPGSTLGNTTGSRINLKVRFSRKSAVKNRHGAPLYQAF